MEQLDFMLWRLVFAHESAQQVFAVRVLQYAFATEPAGSDHGRAQRERRSGGDAMGHTWERTDACRLRAFERHELEDSGGDALGSFELDVVTGAGDELETAPGMAVANRLAETGGITSLSEPAITQAMRRTSPRNANGSTGSVPPSWPNSTVGAAPARLASG